MANSFTFDSNDMADIGVIVTPASEHDALPPPIAFESVVPFFGSALYRGNDGCRRVKLSGWIVPPSGTTMVDCMDTFKTRLNTFEAKTLTVDCFPGYTWTATLEGEVPAAWEPGAGIGAAFQLTFLEPEVVLPE